MQSFFVGDRAIPYWRSGLRFTLSDQYAAVKKDDILFINCVEYTQNYYIFSNILCTKYITTDPS